MNWTIGDTPKWDREGEIRRARNLITDKQLVSFFRSISKTDRTLAVRIMNNHLDDGDTLDDVFYTGNEYGFLLNVKRTSDSGFKIDFGCMAAPLAGDGGKWKVKFDGERVVHVEEIATWIS